MLWEFITCSAKKEAEAALAAVEMRHRDAHGKLGQAQYVSISVHLSALALDPLSVLLPSKCLMLVMASKAAMNAV